jgi:hypothetical protein
MIFGRDPMTEVRIDPMVWIRGDQRNPAEPEEGYYSFKMVKHGVDVGARIWRDVLPASIGDISGWSSSINNVDKDFVVDPELSEPMQQIWLFGKKISKSEYDFLLARYDTYKNYWPDHPFAKPEIFVPLRLWPPIGKL